MPSRAVPFLGLAFSNPKITLKSVSAGARRARETDGLANNYLVVYVVIAAVASAARWRSVITASAHDATDDTSPSASSTQCHALLHMAGMGRPACQCRHAVWICSAGQALGGLGGRCRWSGKRYPSEVATRLY